MGGSTYEIILIVASEKVYDGKIDSETLKFHFLRIPQKHIRNVEENKFPAKNSTSLFGGNQVDSLPLAPSD